MKGNYLENTWKHEIVKCDFYTLKGIIENLLDYLGFKNRYTFVAAELPEMHPGICAKILLDRKEIGLIGRVHPSYKKDEIYVAEVSMTALYESKIKLAKTAAYDYGRDNIDSLTSDCTDVKIGKLIELDYLSGDDKTGKNLINPNTNKTMNNIVICIYYEDNTVKTKIENE